MVGGFDPLDRPVYSTSEPVQTRRSTIGGCLFIRNVFEERVSGTPPSDFETLRKLFRKLKLENVLIVTTKRETVGKANANRGESEVIRHFKLALDDGAKLVRFYESSPYDIIGCITRNVLIKSELNERIRPHQDELKAIREEMKKALRDQEEKLRREFEQEIRQAQEQRYS